MKKVFGLTGGVAAGKSTVGKFFAELGVLVIDADQLARDVVAPESEGLREIVATFGDQYLQADGALDRAKLGALIFSDSSARAKLNEMTHPRIRSLFDQKVKQSVESDTPYILYEAALLVESGSYKNLDGLVVVSACSELQVKRVMKRNSLDEEAARARIAAQLPLDAKLRVANIVILNDNDREALKARTQQAHEGLLRLAGVTPVAHLVSSSS